MTPATTASLFRYFLMISIMLFLALATGGYAQMGHGMMRGGHMMEGGGHMMGGHMMGTDRDSGKRNMMGGEVSDDHRRMMNGMMSATQDIAIMMRQMSVMMGNITDQDRDAMKARMHKMSSLMKDMASEMNTLSRMMLDGAVSDSDMRATQKRVMDLQERMRDIRSGN
jgi:hypothetical protein